MEKEMMIAELSANIEGHRNKLLDLMKAYDIACLGLKIQDERFNSIYDRALQDHAFFADRDSDYLGKKKGDRLVGHKQMYLMSKSDLKRFTKITNELSYKEGLTDKQGFYTELWLDIKCEARIRLVDYILDHILPIGVTDMFRFHRLNIVATEKLINIMRKAVGAPAEQQTAVSPAHP